MFASNRACKISESIVDFFNYMLFFKGFFIYILFLKNIKCVPDTRKSIQKLSNLQYYDSKSMKLTHWEVVFVPEIKIPKHIKICLRATHRVRTLKICILSLKRWCFSKGFTFLWFFEKSKSYAWHPQICKTSYKNSFWK